MFKLKYRRNFINWTYVVLAENQSYMLQDCIKITNIKRPLFSQEKILKSFNQLSIFNRMGHKESLNVILRWTVAGQHKRGEHVRERKRRYITTYPYLLTRTKIAAPPAIESNPTRKKEKEIKPHHSHGKRERERENISLNKQHQTGCLVPSNIYR